MAKILIIDDDQLVCQSLSLVARRKGHEADCAHTLAVGLKKASQELFDVVFLDVRLPDGNGLDALPHLEKLPHAPEIIIMTGYGDPSGAELAIKSGVWDYLEKGASVREIMLSLVRALQYRKQKQAGAAAGVAASLKREDIIGCSPQLMCCLDQVAQAAASDASVLITGETGTGKELFARAVHRNSLRANRPFVVVDCAALPETLIESMLFGHEKGVFTGADQAREGLIRQADGGTLFLDEIGEMPLTLQKAFLRVLQERRFRPLGSTRELTSDFRLVAATNRNLEEMVRQERFRNDLLFRLRSFVIELPVLRGRAEDVRQLARYHVDRLCERYAVPPKGFAPEFLKHLAAYAWPGNVRELVNALERAIVAARSEVILFPKHLPMQIRIEVMRSSLRKDSLVPPAEPAAEQAEPKDLPKIQAFRDSVYNRAEQQYLHDLMVQADHDIGRACRISGLSQSRLYALLKKQSTPPDKHLKPRPSHPAEAEADPTP
ncbi:sigma-54 dependent transcriptional regulator [Geobacter sp. SVR]|uniref:sigma-54-dependent transcriptional regulator n=1 Tax=Geobacter sp. SVR TaxID=2495594 RepID=UPI00143EF8BB|nr:sigma-54 dependent transcriptional regulator [Geobacter sp. SVR]BCS54445.1 Fis family transcriptional regulator [Geobacter sp. SVR]GCF87677.1 Fis family transcriptional regulator [Geobacter sp. SVR]